MIKYIVETIFSENAFYFFLFVWQVQLQKPLVPTWFPKAAGRYMKKSAQKKFIPGGLRKPLTLIRAAGDVYDYKNFEQE